MWHDENTHSKSTAAIAHVWCSLQGENGTFERSSIANVGTRLNSKSNYGPVSREIIGRISMDILEWYEVVIIFILAQYSSKANKGV